MESFNVLLALVGIVVIVASLVAGLVEKRGLPLVAAFLALGAMLGPWGLGLVDIGFDTPALHVLSVLGLALVLFSDAVTIDVKEIRRRWGLVWRILGPGTLVPAILMTVAARFLLDLSWPAAAILGAALASTDPVLLRSILRSTALPPTARIALRLETGMNDVVLLPIVVLSMLVVAPDMGHGGGHHGVGRSLVGLFILGPALGALVGWVGIEMLTRVRRGPGVRRDYESLYALGLAFTAFAAAEMAGGSGFLAAFAAGLMINAQDDELCECFLEYGEATAEMLLLLTFVALGTSLIWTGLGVLSPATLAFAVIAVAVRTFVLFPVLALAGIRGRDRRLIAFFGPRGLSSLLLTLLPVFAGIPGARELFTVACLVVLLSVVVHGVGMALFLRRHPKAAAAVEATVEGRDPAPARAHRTGHGEALLEPAPLDMPKLREVPAGPDAGEAPLLITLDELKSLQDDGRPVIVTDVRRAYRDETERAAGAVYLDPDHAARDAAALDLDKRATIALYCT
jgi:NhaP-type Na+/H+ or K+/H+ antiporter